MGIASLQALGIEDRIRGALARTVARPGGRARPNSYEEAIERLIAGGNYNSHDRALIRHRFGPAARDAFRAANRLNRDESVAERYIPVRVLPRDPEPGAIEYLVRLEGTAPGGAGFSRSSLAVIRSPGVLTRQDLLDHLQNGGVFGVDQRRRDTPGGAEPPAVVTNLVVLSAYRAP